MISSDLRWEVWLLFFGFCLIKSDVGRNSFGISWVCVNFNFLFKSYISVNLLFLLGSCRGYLLFLFCRILGVKYVSKYKCF